MLMTTEKSEISSVAVRSRLLGDEVDCDGIGRCVMDSRRSSNRRLLIVRDPSYWRRLSVRSNGTFSTILRRALLTGRVKIR